MARTRERGRRAMVACFSAKQGTKAGARSESESDGKKNKEQLKSEGAKI